MPEERRSFFTLEDGTDALPETSVKDYHSTLRNMTEERRYQHRGLSLKSRSKDVSPYSKFYEKASGNWGDYTQFVFNGRNTSCFYVLDLRSSVFKGKYLQEVTRISSCLVTCFNCWIATSIHYLIFQEINNHSRIIMILIPNPADIFVYICELFAQATCFIGRDSSVGIATGYGLDGQGIESRWGRDFFVPVHTGPGAHPASYTMGTGSLSRG
jgi:hypothetical protein